MKIDFMSWQDATVDSLDWSGINMTLREKGCCFIQHIRSDREMLLELSSACGEIQLHERADKDGVVEVKSNGDSLANQAQSVFRGLSSGVFPPHTDGAYLNTYYVESNTLREVAPPKLIILQCVRAAEDGGESILVDGQRLLRHIRSYNRRLYETLLRPAALFYRAGNKAVNTPVFMEVSPGKFWFRFRDDVRVKPSIEWALATLFDDYIQDPAYHVEFKLPDNGIVLIDNLRMLHMRRAFRPNKDGTSRVLRRTWIHNNELDGDIELNVSALPEAFLDATKYGCLSKPNQKIRRLKTSLGIEME